MIRAMCDRVRRRAETGYILSVPVVLVMLLLPIPAISECESVCVHQAEASGGLFGGYVSAVGDVNGDGTEDYSVGEHFWNGSTGRVFIFSGADCDDTLFVVAGQSGNDRFGIAITGVGDMNDDGLADFMIGGDLYNSSSIYEGPGRAYLFYGQSQLGTVTLNAADANWIIDGDPTLNGSFGRSMKGGVDLNLDGVEDLVIGAVTASNYQGRLYIFLGNSSVTHTTLNVSDAFVTIIGAASDDAFAGIFDLGDFNGDGFIDITASATGNNAGGDDAGRAYAFLGPFTVSGTHQADDAGIKVTGVFANQTLGVPSFLRDINGDGCDELAIGAPTKGTSIGNVYIFYGSTDVSGMLYPDDADVTITGTDPDGYFGSRMSGGGDIDGDGRGDLVIAEPYSDESATDAGRVYLMLGRDFPTSGQMQAAQAGCSFTGDAAQMYLGASLCTAGDFDNDGANEVIIGGPSGVQSFGAAHVYGFRKQYVYLDIKLGSCTNPLNVKNAGWAFLEEYEPVADVTGVGQLDKKAPFAHSSNGKLPAVILGTDELPASLINPHSVTIEGVTPTKWQLEDVGTPVGEPGDECTCHTAGPDGHVDLTLKFYTALVAQALGDVNAGDIIPLTISGQLQDGTPFEGVDCVLIVQDVVTVTESSTYNYPNPFNPSTQISFNLPEASDVTLDVFNVLGQKVSTVADGFYEAGEHTATWDGSGFASGVYLYHLTTNQVTETKKMILLK